MQLLKNADGNYMVPNWITSDGVNIGAMRVIANQLVPVNEAYIFDSSPSDFFEPSFEYLFAFPESIQAETLAFGISKIVPFFPSVL